MIGFFSTFMSTFPGHRSNCRSRTGSYWLPLGLFTYHVIKMGVLLHSLPRPQHLSTLASMSGNDFWVLQEWEQQGNREIPLPKTGTKKVVHAVLLFSQTSPLRKYQRFQLNIYFSSFCTTCFVTNPAESERSLFQIQILDKAQKIKLKGTI